MQKIDLIIDNIMYARIIKERAHQDELLEEALAAARELRELQPVAWCVERKVATCKEEYAELWRSNGEGVTPLYALDEVTK